ECRCYRGDFVCRTLTADHWSRLSCQEAGAHCGASSSTQRPSGPGGLSGVGASPSTAPPEPPGSGLSVVPRGDYGFQFGGGTGFGDQIDHGCARLIVERGAEPGGGGLNRITEPGADL